MRTAHLTVAGLGAGALLALAAPLAAQAHVTVDPTSASAGSYTVLTFSVGHGCDGASTTALSFDVPEPILSVTPTIVPGWTAEKVLETLDEPAEGAHGESVTERVGRVTYTAATPLPDGFRQTFQLQVFLPEDAAGETLEFPVLQSCEVGETSWSESAVDGAEPEHPAPALAVGEATADAHDHGTASAAGDHDASGGHDAEASGSSTEATTDTLARVLGVAGLAVGVVGIVLAVTARASRKQQG
ncbi:YcnI family protein [Agromyces sp. MMS24-JH15]|uniref:YcnI family protein n=1 Tax=Agromyces sp. MMS24-JH15 TaxID=3243765 RepID=UPI0037497B47